MNRLPKFQGEKLVKQLLDCRFEKEIKNMDRLAKIQGQKRVETTARFSI